MTGSAKLFSSAVLLTVLAGCVQAGGPAPGGSDVAAPSSGEGEIVAGHLVGMVVDPELFPIADVTVNVAPGDAYAVTDAAGKFDINPLEPGTYVVTATDTPAPPRT